MNDAIDNLPASELAFHFRSGRLCLDLAATVGERWRRSFERLRTPEDLGRWLVEVGLLEARPLVRPRDLDEARALREAVYRLAKAAPSGTPDPAGVAEVNRWALRPALAPRLAADGRSVAWVADRPVRACLATIARDAVDLLSGPLAARIRECVRPDCALLFVDTSPPGRRRWCSMDGCGNKTKTTTYRRRKRGQERKETG